MIPQSFLKNIQLVNIYECGNHKIGLNSEIEPSLVVLLKHVEYGYILIDTGYGNFINNDKLRNLFYKTVTRSEFDYDNHICYQLIQDGIPRDQIKHIIITHFHPDNIGALDNFYHSQIHVSKHIYKTLLKKNNTFISPLLNENIIDSFKTIEKESNKIQDHFLNKYFINVYDLFGEGSLLIVNLPGHTEDQIGIYISDLQLFFISDAATLNKNNEIETNHFLLNDNRKKYQHSLEILMRIQKEHPEITFISQHNKL